MSEAVIRVEPDSGGSRWRVEIENHLGRVADFCAPLSDADLAAIPNLDKRVKTWSSFVAHMAPNSYFRPTATVLRAVGGLIRERLFSAPKLAPRFDQLQVRQDQPLRLALEVDENDAVLAMIPLELAWQPNAFVFKSDHRLTFRVLSSFEKKSWKLGVGARVLVATAHHEGQRPNAEELTEHATAVVAALQTAGFRAEHLADATQTLLFERLGTADGFDFLYLIAHGVEDEDNGGLLILRDGNLAGDDFVQRLVAISQGVRQLQAVILCSCSSAVVEASAARTTGIAQRLVAPLTTGDRSCAAHAAVGFRAPIGVDFALRFFERMFVALGNKSGLEEAFAEARSQELDSEPQWALPLLYSRHRNLDEMSFGTAASALPTISIRGGLGRPFEIGKGPKGERDDALGREAIPREPAIRSRLPRQPRPYFVGRTPELEELLAWVKPSQGGVAQITAVRGAGGIGKTELALVLAHDQHVAHEAVIWLERPDLNVRGALFDLLSLADGPRPADDTPTETLAAELRRRYAVEGGLLVLDDLESAETAEILNPGGRWNVLATTRKEKLIAGAKEIALDLLSMDEAIHLLSQVAWDQPAPPAEEREDAAALVERLGFLPLAIELAGNTIRREVISVAEYAESLDVGVGPAQSDLERIDVIVLRSLRSLDEVDERVFLTLALLPRSGVPLETLANALDSGVVPTTRRVDRLIKHGLVRWSPEAGRYGMHAHLRAAGVRRVKERPELREKLLGGVGRALQDLMAWVYEPMGKRTFEARERWLGVNDVIDAIETADLSEDAPSSTPFANVLAGATLFRSGLDAAERQKFLDEAVRLSTNGPLMVRANALQARGDLLRFRGDLHGASQDYDVALGLYEVVGDRLGQANVHMARGDLRRFLPDLEGASRDYDLALGYYEAVDDRLGQANVLHARGLLNCFRSDLSGASRDFDQALALFEQVESRLGQANVLQARGDLRRFCDDFPGATRDYDISLRICEEVEDRLGQANVLKARGGLAYAQQDLDSALARYLEALPLYEALGARYSQANVLAEMSRVFNLRSETEAAETAARSALELARQSENRYAENLAKETLQALADRVEPPAPEPPAEAPPNTDEA